MMEECMEESKILGVMMIFNQLRGGRPKVDEANSEVVGRGWRENVRNEISRCQLIRLHTNWYRSNIRIYEE